VSQQREGLPNQNLVVAEGATLKPQREEELVRCSFSTSHFVGQKDIRREKRSTMREFFLKRCPAKKFIFLLVEKQQ